MCQAIANHCLVLLGSSSSSCLTSLKQLNQIHAHFIKCAVDRNTHELSKLIQFSALSSHIPSSFFYARELFTRIEHPNLFLYNTMIRGSSIYHHPQEAIRLYFQLRNDNLLPNNFTFPFVLRACESQIDLKTGREVHGCILRLGFGSHVYVLTTLLNVYSNCGESVRDAAKVFEEMRTKDVVSWNSMISGYLRHGQLELAGVCFDRAPQKSLVSWNLILAGYAKCRKIKDAERLFLEMPEKDTASWNSLISGYIKIGDFVSAERSFERMPVKDVVSWTTMIDGYTKNGQYNHSLRLFHQMQLDGIAPTEVTLISVMAACANLGALDLGRWVHRYLEKKGFTVSNNLGTALIDMYAKCGAIDKSLEVFSVMGARKDVVAWTSLIVGLAMNGRCREALDCYSRMLGLGLIPDEITFLGVLCACSHGGFVEKGHWYFDSMQTDYQLKPGIKHYTCMVDLLGRAGLLEEAEKFVRSMSIDADSVIWSSLLAACRVHKNVELGELVMENLSEMEPENNGNYVTLSNIYAALGRWNEVAETRKKLKEKGVERTPGCSFIEVNYQVHEFLSGSVCRPNHMEVHEMLHLLAGGIKKVADLIPSSSILQETI